MEKLVGGSPDRVLYRTVQAKVIVFYDCLKDRANLLQGRYFRVRPISANSVPSHPKFPGLRTLVLQSYNKSPLQVGHGGVTHDVPYSAQPSFTDLFATVIGFIRRQFLVVLSVAVMTIGLCGVYFFTTPPLYSA